MGVPNAKYNYAVPAPGVSLTIEVQISFLLQSPFHFRFPKNKKIDTPYNYEGFSIWGLFNVWLIDDPPAQINRLHSD